MTSAMTGGCLCGAIRYEAGGEPTFSLRCHCRDCQRQSGSGYIAAMRLPAARFRITKGAPKRWLGRADSGNDITRVFCGECGAPIYSITPGPSPSVYGLRAGGIDQPAQFALPKRQIWCCSALLWSMDLRKVEKSERQ